MNRFTRTLPLLFLAAALIFAAPPAPHIARISPDTGSIGNQVSIIGTGFGDTQGASKVTVVNVFKGRHTVVEAQVVIWKDTDLAIKIPQGIPFRGQTTIMVTVNGAPSNGALFALKP